MSDGNCEAYDFAKQLLEILADSGWQTGDGVVVDPEFPRKLKGVLIRADSRDTQQAFQQNDLLLALQKAGVEAKYNFEVTYDPLQILVGW